MTCSLPRLMRTATSRMGAFTCNANLLVAARSHPNLVATPTAALSASRPVESPHATPPGNTAGTLPA